MCLLFAFRYGIFNPYIFVHIRMLVFNLYLFLFLNVLKYFSGEVFFWYRNQSSV